MENSLTLKKSLLLLKKGEISSVDLVDACLKQIEKFDKKVNVFVTLNKNALKEAKGVKNKPTKNKPLLGIPFAIKDNFLTKGLRTTASSRLLDDYIPQYDSTVVKKLKDAGAIILGKANMDAWAHGSSTETSDYGSTKNPWDVTRLPGGSSGGSAAAVSADMCTFAIGSETAGSVRGPSSWCGITGLKPTYGRVSRYGVIAMGSSLDCPGPMTKSVEDAQIVYKVIAGKDPMDATTSTKPVGESKKASLKGIRIAIAREYFMKGMDKLVVDSILEAAKNFEKLGAKVDYVEIMEPRHAVGVYTVVQRSEVSSNLARYDGIRFGKDRTHFGEEAKRRISLGAFTLSSGYQDRYYKKAQRVRTLFIEDFKRIFKNFDLIIAPSMPGTAPKLGVTKDAAMFGEMADILNEPSSIAGLPGISVPCGFMDSLPLGLNIIGPQFGEEKVLLAAKLYQNETNWKHVKPNLK